MRELRRSNDRMFLGVAAGFAEYFEMDKAIWRAIWLVACIVVFPLVLAYLILGLLLPAAPRGWAQGQPAEPQPRPAKRMTKSRDRWLSGVAGGVAEYLDLDPALVRLLFLLSLFVGGTGLFIYLVLAIVMPGPDYSYQYYQSR